MSVPFGGSQPAAPLPPSPDAPSSGQNMGFILSLATAGLGLIVYACSFSDDAFSAGITTSVVLPLLLGGGLLAGAVALPKKPNTLLPATLLNALGVLILLLLVIKNEDDTSAIVVVILIVGLLELAACTVALLMDHGMIKIRPRMPGYGGQPQTGGWTAPPGAYPQPGYGAVPEGYGAAPGGYGQPGQYGSQQPGQYPQQYGSAPASGAQPPYGQAGQSGHSAQPGQSGHSGGQHAHGRGQSEANPTMQFSHSPYGQQPYGSGSQSGTPTGGFGSTI